MTAQPYQARRVELAKIHIAKAQLGLDDETYRAMLWTIARVRTAADLDDAGRRRVLEHLRSRGFREPGRRPHTGRGDGSIRKIGAMLAEAGRPWAYADAMAQRMFEVDRVSFCTRDQLRRLIAALAIDQRRRTRGDA